MAFTIDIDTGGTFTDGFVSGPGVARAVKTPTTPHDTRWRPAPLESLLRPPITA